MTGSHVPEAICLVTQFLGCHSPQVWVKGAPGSARRRQRHWEGLSASNLLLPVLEASERGRGKGQGGSGALPSPPPQGWVGGEEGREEGGKGKSNLICFPRKPQLCLASVDLSQSPGRSSKMALRGWACLARGAAGGWEARRVGSGRLRGPGLLSRCLKVLTCWSLLGCEAAGGTARPPTPPLGSHPPLSTRVGHP